MRNGPDGEGMGIPSFGKLHIPSCDFAAMISPKHFEEFCYQPILKEEIEFYFDTINRRTDFTAHFEKQAPWAGNHAEKGMMLKA